ncbi:MAG: heme a synthase [Micromonosporaceae bacterium]
MFRVRLGSLPTDPQAFRRVTLVSLAANVVIVITGGVVRLTDSGLGCPTWPRCTGASYVTTPAAGYHGIIEFGNRSLTYVLVALAAGALLLARRPGNRTRRRVRYAWLSLATIPVQAVVGGLTVLTHLNPWVVSAHFLLSMAVIAVTYALYAAAVSPDGPRRPVVAAPLRGLAWTVLGTSLAVLAAGTVVTGSGPHAGDHGARRTGLDAGTVAQLHTDAVMLLVGLSLALWFALRGANAPHRAVRAAAVLVGVELAQGVIGFVQYFTHVPALLVGLHMAGACAVWLATLAIFPALSATVGAAPDPLQPHGDRVREPAGGPEREAEVQGRLGQLQLKQ